MKRKPLAEWRGMRALAESAGAPLELIAQATGRSRRSLELAAGREGWRLETPVEVDIAGKVREIAALLMERVERLGRRALEDGEKIDKSEIEGLLSLIKGLDRMAEITRTEESAAKKQSRRDEDTAFVLRHIHQRIFELAQELAAKMGGDACREPRG